jgi:hypothetical protein
MRMVTASAGFRVAFGTAAVSAIGGLAILQLLVLRPRPASVSTRHPRAHSVTSLPRMVSAPSIPRWTSAVERTAVRAVAVMGSTLGRVISLSVPGHDFFEHAGKRFAGEPGL